MTLDDPQNIRVIEITADPNPVTVVNGSAAGVLTFKSGPPTAKTGSFDGKNLEIPAILRLHLEKQLAGVDLDSQDLELEILLTTGTETPVTNNNGTFFKTGHGTPLDPNTGAITLITTFQGNDGTPIEIKISGTLRPTTPQFPVGPPILIGVLVGPQSENLIDANLFTGTLAWRTLDKNAPWNPVDNSGIVRSVVELIRFSGQFAWQDCPVS